MSVENTVPLHEPPKTNPAGADCVAAIPAAFPTPSPTLKGALFRSYAREDAAAARRICEALRATAVDV